MGTILLAGIYGVGKSTLAQKLSEATGIPYYSAGDLISAKNGEQYGASKAVSDKDRNQDLLIESVTDLLQASEHILLAGHFCILSKQNQIDFLPDSVFDKLQIEKIILLEAESIIIQAHLEERDHRSYSTDLIGSMLIAERKAAQRTSLRLSVPLVVYKMRYSSMDLDETLTAI